MELDSVAYRYSPSELSALMLLQGFDRIPCLPSVSFPDKEAFHKGFSSLESSSVLSNVEGRVLLDSVHAFLIRRLCGCDRYLSVSSKSREAALCFCEDICLLMTSSRNGWLLYAAPGFTAEIETDFYDCLSQFDGQMQARAVKKGKMLLAETMPACSMKTQLSRPLLEQLAE